MDKKTEKPVTFEIPDDIKQGFGEISRPIQDAAFNLSDQLLEAGLGYREATSAAAALFIRAAWGVAAAGRLADGGHPNREHFFAAVRHDIQDMVFPCEEGEDDGQTEPTA